GALGAGHQAALMAPTEILAEQHGRTIARALGAPAVRAAFEQMRGRPGPEIGLLIGSTPRAQRRPLLDAAASGELDVLIGTQAFVVCPLVEESENVAARAATAEFERLSHEIFPELRLGLMHGRMKGAEKDAAMASLRAGETQVLVATTVIEVGIDVPNATVMLIEGADRFGLAQLHQLRGRVGRGADQSYCILLAGTASLDGQERLRVIESTNDGFKLAEEDL